jgi:hypothetical protein
VDPGDRAARRQWLSSRPGAAAAASALSEPPGATQPVPDERAVTAQQEEAC